MSTKNGESTNVGMVHRLAPGINNDVTFELNTCSMWYPSTWYWLDINISLVSVLQKIIGNQINLVVGFKY
jgi:hypothetical protein